jgi:signal transduction histidine kinase
MCPIPESLAPPGDVPPPGVPPEGSAGSTGSTAQPGPGFDRLRFISQGSVSRFPFEKVTRMVDTDTGTYTIEAAAPVDEVRRSVDAVRRVLWWALPMFIAVVAAAAWAFVGRALRPVEAIRAEVEAIGGSTMHRRVPEPGSEDEVGRLARTMNAMLGRLEASARRQRQFVSDASHELRSPVATIRADLEVAQLEGPTADWPAVAASVLREEARLERLIDDLLVLAAADEGASTRRAAPVDLAVIVAEDAARARRVPVTATVPVAGADAGGTGRPVIDGDAAQLRRVVANLVDNAARHARSRVAVTLAAPPGAGVRLTVDDDGDGIAPADREQVFERFARLDEGRARDHGGAGLGLAVVRSLVERHGGTVTVGESPTGGARLEVTLPGGSATASPLQVVVERVSTTKSIAP